MTPPKTPNPVSPSLDTRPTCPVCDSRLECPDCTPVALSRLDPEDVIDVLRYALTPDVLDAALRDLPPWALADLRARLEAEIDRRGVPACAGLRSQAQR
jgi:hypothetical protein